MTNTVYKTYLLAQNKAQQNQKNGAKAAQIGQGDVDIFEALSFPTRKNEEWKYTSFDRILKKLPLLASSISGFDSVWLANADIEGLDATKIVTLNGVLVYHDTLPQGVSLNANSTKGQELNNTHKIDKTDIFEQIVASFKLDQLAVSVDKNLVLKKPLYFINFIDGQGQNVLAQRSFQINIGSNANATMLENQVTVGNQTSLSNSILQIQVGQNAELHHIVLQNDGSFASQINRSYISQQRDSRYSHYSFSLSGEIIRNNTAIALDGENATGNLFGLYLLAGKEHVDNHTLVDHRVPNCVSNEMYKGVLKDESIGVFNGKVMVQPHAQKTNAYQQNRNLLLSDRATINTKPQLEIWADDVKCSHGCTVGQLDQEQLFYLQSRGLDYDTSKALMVYAFASEIVEKLPIDSLKQFLFSQIAQKLNFNFG